MENEVARLEGYIFEIQRDANEKRKKLKGGNATKEEIWSVTGQEQSEIGMYYGEIVVGRDGFWRSEARKRFIEIPPRTDESMWQEASGFGETLFLSDLAILRIRNAIKKDQRELITLWTGLIGAITGLVAVILALK